MTCSLESIKMVSFDQLLLLLLLTFMVNASKGTVLELSDKFLGVRNEGSWLVKFYAPWCGHCKKLEPVWAEVGSSVELIDKYIRVGKMDATRWGAAAKELNIRGFPTILLLTNGKIFTYYGDRNADDIVEFALKAVGPAVRELHSSEDFEKVRKRAVVCFLLVKGSTKHNEMLEKAFIETAEEYMEHSYFYTIFEKHLPANLVPSEVPAIIVYKDEMAIKFDSCPGAAAAAVEGSEESAGSGEDGCGGDSKQPLNVTLQHWVGVERFAVFPQVATQSLYEMARGGRLIVLGVVELLESGRPSREQRQFRSMLEEIARHHHHHYREHFQFAWTDATDTVNSITTSFLAVPNVIVFKPDTYQYYSTQLPPANIDSEAIISLLDDIMAGKASEHGGNSILMRLYRMLFDFFSMIYGMFYNQPLISSLLFGLPISMLVFICCNICCAEGYDGPEEDGDSDDEPHEKKE